MIAISRAQAEALLTLAESLEACERLKVHVGAWNHQGSAKVEIALNVKAGEIWDDFLDGKYVRSIVADYSPKPSGS